MKFKNVIHRFAAFNILGTLVAVMLVNIFSPPVIVCFVIGVLCGAVSTILAFFLPPNLP